ncbi:MAG: fructose bisphosphate aldolase [Pseudomonadota bacterium]
MANQKMAEQMGTSAGFVAALDQSGGSTPKALAAYGVSSDAYANDDEMFDLIHDMRCRIVNAPAFTGDKIVGAILFEMTMDREINGKPSARFLWEDRGVVPFLKIDKGLMDEADGVQLMKPMDHLDTVLPRAASYDVFGTKARSVINSANPVGIAAIIDQQFAEGKRVLAHGLVPMLEPEINITIPDKAKAEDILRDETLKHLDQLGPDEIVVLKLTLPEVPNIYEPLVNHPNVMRVVALSGGYSRTDANARLAQNKGVIASFSRGLTEGLTADQSDAAFGKALSDAIDDIYAASVAG